MKCPNCGFNSFDYLEVCKKCRLPLDPDPTHKTLHRRKGASEESLKSLIEKRDVNSQETVREAETGSFGHHETIAEITGDDTDTQRGREESPGTPDPGSPAGNLRDDFKPDAEDIEPHAHIPEESSAPLTSRVEAQMPIRDKSVYTGLNEGSHEPPPDPALYTESNEAHSATNRGNETEPGNEAESYSIAGLRPRAIAFVIDIVIVSLIAYLAIGSGLYLLGDSGIDESELSRVFVPIYALLFFLASTYFIFLHSFTGRTIGKMMMGIKIINEEGRPLGLWESFKRWVGYYISAVFLFAGFIWSVFDADSQAWHDKIAGTYVVIG